MSGPGGQEHIWAGLLNGVMITALGGVFPLFIAWRIIDDWRDLVGGRFDPNWSHVGQAIAVVAMSGAIMRFGARMIRRQIAELKAHRRSAGGGTPS